ncbi:hypothetical protein [Nocardioides sp. SYSU D00065]|uniref:hypothetical protein n=1 Tax=Nocardioides sp. SYSU D00065 TaxID=2817378 RepID=UPI001B34068C|nr:hypothetical protein [Nocardioides sp. SYSU D00065]
MPTPPPPAAGFASSNRILAGTLMGALVVIGVAVSFVLPADTSLPIVVPVAQVAIGVAVHLLLDAFGYRLPALPTTLDAEEAAAQARGRWSSAMVLRFAIAEAVAIASLAAAFVLPDGGILVYAGGAAVSLVLMAVHVWPWERPVGKAADALEADGRASGLREVFGLAPQGPVQRL